MQQEALYKTDQYVKHKGKKLNVRFAEEYFEAVPRPIEEERTLLKEDIEINGLEESIKLNVDGIVLDGHTRIEICEELGWKKRDETPIVAKYDIKEFATTQDERDYVIKTNLMRRQLNTFQKVKLVAKLYNNNPHTQREKTRYDILLQLKEKKLMNAREIGQIIGMHKGNVLKVLRGLKDDFCVNYKIKKEDLNKTTQQVHHYYILPGGEEILYKGRPEAITLKKLGRSVGVNRNHISRAILLLQKADTKMLDKLESGSLGIMKAYQQITDAEEKVPRVTSYHYLKGGSKVICPRCEQVSLKREWGIFDDGKTL